MADSTREGCGRCSMTTVVDATADESRDPLGDDRIELDEAALRAASPGAWLGRLSARLDAAAERFVYGDR
ncbi:hypothetical protein G3A49_00165 [Haloferax volcanii]|jgi:hypothetical protein|uniref:Uncharacterized protein n=3 Tax=Haloferax TaxID=2251 RepID=A0A6C0UUK7_HALVO|nr:MULTISPECIES: hypothetical protein [Haloferax]ELZ90192.1 hypothetical protein C452_10862 [Haloferax alexandrinus JCM 10717]NLV01000.1 hypothetical protein [Haloferax alexandrinus]QIB76638.1 hypothetical protein G3A49_00165 [Haloferax alexandrinus]RDZ29930.1 hypothetical protein DEQ67_17050 [Haloferax sp. Atlit-48N]RDZ36548.1 hypothetical protein C5B88_00165 [Haloferax sp. Atlit-24N]